MQATQTTTPAPKKLSPYKKFTRYVSTHKVISGVVLLVLIGVGWGVHAVLAKGATGETRYILGNVASGTIVASLTESGQVSADNTLDVTPQASGEITYLPVKTGEAVAAGQLLAQIDPTTAQQAVVSAKENLQSAQLALQQLQEPAKTLTLTQQQDAISQQQQTIIAQYQSGFSDVTNAFVDLPAIMSGLEDVDLGNEAAGTAQWNIDYYETQAAQFSPSAQSYRNDAYNDYETALQSYNQTFSDFKNASSTPDQATVQQLLTETSQTTQLVATAVKSANDLVEFYTNILTQNGDAPKAVAATQITNLNSYESKAQSHISTLLGDNTALQNDQDQLTINQQTLQQTQAGADPLQVQSDQLEITKAQEALQQAETTLAQYSVTAPFSGVIGSVPVNQYDQAGAGTTIATLITQEQYVDLSVNEVDAAKIQVGEQATLTFDALPNLTLTGTVAEVSPLGTVTQGVVSYDVRVGFDAQNSQVKAGMTATAAIITAAHQNVLTVPSTAVKTTTGGGSYVLVFNPPLTQSASSTAASSQGVTSKVAPVEVPVVTGISDTINTEIDGGLTLGEQIVVRTSSSGTSATTAAAATTRGGFGGGAAGGGFGGGAAGGAALRGL